MDEGKLDEESMLPGCLPVPRAVKLDREPMLSACLPVPRAVP
jgi:hypothetical protein